MLTPCSFSRTVVSANLHKTTQKGKEQHDSTREESLSGGKDQQLALAAGCHSERPRPLIMHNLKGVLLKL